jgi:hypothetical protein
MPIPAVDPGTGTLPLGVHDASWDEVVAVFGSNPHRAALLGGLQRALDNLRQAGCGRVYLNGSFVTAKDEPADFDGCWEAYGVDPTALDPTLLDFSNGRAAQKEKYGGELFIANSAADPAGTTFIDFFQRDRAGQPKGIIAINL